MELFFKIIIAHILIGDYVLQIDHIAHTKEKNHYLLVYSFLYSVSFYLFFGYDERLMLLMFTHINVNYLKAVEKAIPYMKIW